MCDYIYIYDIRLYYSQMYYIKKKTIRRALFISQFVRTQSSDVFSM